MTWISFDHGGWSGTPQHEIAHDETDDAGPSLVAGWRLRDRGLEVYADRLGLIPLFWHGDSQRIVVADDIAEVVARIPHPSFDAAAVAVFLQLGFYIAQDTPFSGVQVLAPGERVIWTDGRLSRTTPTLPIAQPYPGGWDDALPRYVKLFEQAVARRARRGVGRLTVSGGRDSRHLLLELLRQGHPPPAIITQERPVNNDLDIGRVLAEQAAIPHIALTPIRDGLREELLKNRSSHFLSDEHSWYLQIVPHLLGPLFDGIAGGMLSGTDMFQGDRLLAAMRERDPIDAARGVLAVLGSRLHMLADDYRRRWSRELAAEALARELVRHREAPNPVTSFLFWNRTRREIALIPLCIAAPRAPVRLAYLDADLMAFLFSLPHTRFSGTGFHSYVMERTYPAFAKVPYGEKRKRPRTLALALEETVAALRFGFAPLLERPRSAARVVQTLLSMDSTCISGWLYRVLPLIQASRELGVPLRAE